MRLSRSGVVCAVCFLHLIMYVHVAVFTGEWRKDMIMLLIQLFWIVPHFAASFTVEVPSSPVLVVRGETAFLPCEFVPDHNLTHLVITWQRQEDIRVVHSYYYQRDQLDRQSSDYLNRTKLNHKLIAKGIASLSITNFGLKDAGKYQCIVSNTKGTDRGVVQLVYAALYSEPRLSIHLNSKDVTIQYETEGYPKPEVMWLGSGGQNLSDHQEVSSTSDEGLYFLRSSYVTQNPAFNVTFTLKNPVAHQELQRNVIISYDGNTSSNTSVVLLSILCTILLCSTGVLFWRHWHGKCLSRALLDTSTALRS
ncbi:CD276 antigen-like isoform X2 [Myxocyprinus asiaticus]|uniref:CD276 antigen-like isoform X1 n=1 Tax=Myxocyprinus asiaticus TaxID=70543 RepID=UPI0022212B9D|nr:CD276 antigen-like isoform X1 [Myxocyprinus asiaticus]XP_051506749.1 CD276 antigen-like isoform X2 [Myxocyprinus asiaticus]